jgi:hypothetical protein
VDAEEELEHFNPRFQADEDAGHRKGKYKDRKNEAAFVYFKDHFPLDRLLTVVGTNYRSYSVGASSWLNRLFSVAGEGGPAYNRSDGLVKQTYAQIPGALRTFVHKCHGGPDSLVTSREAYEVATRFFFGDTRARLRLLNATVKRGSDWFGKSEFFFGVSIKPRQVDFELFHQSPEAENCYGPFSEKELTDPDIDFGWAERGHQADLGGLPRHEQAGAGSRSGRQGHGAAAGLLRGRTGPIWGGFLRQRDLPENSTTCARCSRIRSCCIATRTSVHGQGLRAIRKRL